MLQAIVFDFDGVIADTERLHLRASQIVLGAKGIDLGEQEYYGRYLGFDDAGMFRALSTDRNLQFDEQTVAALVAAKTRTWESLIPGGPVLFPGAADCIRRLGRRVPLAIASGALRHEIDLILSRAGLDTCFSAVVSASDNLPSKPAPDFYLQALARLQQVRGNQSPENILGARTVAVEDSRWGLESARRAGLRAVAVTHTYPAAELAGADLVVRSLDQLTVECLDQLCP
jgi:beta-phosphoglucomutase